MAGEDVTVVSNGDEIAALIEQLVASIDFRLAGEYASLGEDMVAEVATGIADRCAAGLDPDGAPWAPNAPGYAAYKAARYGVHQPGELGGQMLSLGSLKGKPEISPDRIRMLYGTGDEPPPSSRSGTPLRDSERGATDRDKADYFEGSGRRFYELDDEIGNKLRDAIEAAISAAIDAQGW